MFFYAKGHISWGTPLVYIKEQGTKDLVRLFVEVDLVRHDDSSRARLKSNFVSCASLSSIDAV